MASTEEQTFLDFLTGNGAVISPQIAFHRFEEMGRGMIALQDIPEDTLLFSLPRPTLLTTSTSKLSSLLPADAWATLTGWTPLILTILYEASLPSSFWTPYFAVLPPPGSFQTLMFWSDEELKELKGSSVLDKIGKDDAEEVYKDIVRPFVEKFRDVFGDVENYALDRFHWAGSLILSRSFHVENGEQEEEESDDEEEEETERVEDVAMVPLADHLNARSGAENAKLFYEPLSLNMISTAPIPAGQQVFNTYGAPPNFDLLRRYGHVDAAQPEADLSEIGLELVASVIGGGMGLTEEEIERRAEWLLELGLDDAFSITHADPLPTELLSAIALFLLPTSSPALDKAMSKDSPPKGRLTDPELVKWCNTVLERRLAEFESSIEDDENLLAQGGLTLRRKLAVRARLGEKQVLRSAVKSLETAAKAEGKEKRKRPSGDGADVGVKKSKTRS